MGALYRHTCSNCGYEAVVSGGVDVGMLRYYSITIGRLDCQELYDVTLLEPRPQETLSDPAEAGWIQRKLRCPEDPKHRWELYQPLRSCPACRSGQMDAGDRPELLSD